MPIILYFFNMNPVKYDYDQTPMFSSSDIDIYGYPELYGYENYRVIESRDLVLVSDYKMEHEYDLKPIHRYDRIARFKNTLYQLIGERGSVPDNIVHTVDAYLRKDSSDIWNDTRAILKHYKQRIYYDRIPLILKKLGRPACFKINDGYAIAAIINDFKALSVRFENRKIPHTRRYFPNIRFVALKLLQMHGFVPTYEVPFIRTTRKKKSLERLWNDLVNNV